MSLRPVPRALRASLQALRPSVSIQQTRSLTRTPPTPQFNPTGASPPNPTTTTPNRTTQPTPSNGYRSTNTNTTPTNSSQNTTEPPIKRTENISKTGLADQPLELEDPTADRIDWTRSFHGLSAAPFPKEAADILLAETNPEEVEIKPDGIVYLPEIKYRRILNRAFGPGGWGLVPRSESIVTPKTVTREYALVCNGR